MKKITYMSEYFSVKDTLECGQVFRFVPFKNGYKVFSLDKCCYCYNQGDKAIIECEDNDYDYFYNYFDLDRDYKEIVLSAEKENIDILSKASNAGKGIRILNQEKEETLFSFIVSQNNNIPRIKGIIEKLCTNLGEKKEFFGEEYYSFPSVSSLANQTEEFYKSIGLGYRADYIKSVAQKIVNGYSLEDISALSTEELKKELISLHGVGPKVADCVAFFGFRRTDSFPVDTWIEKVYKEDFNGKLIDRKKIAISLVEKFKFNAGYYQQYLFFYKRQIKNNDKI